MISIAANSLLSCRLLPFQGGVRRTLSSLPLQDRVSETVDSHPSIPGLFYRQNFLDRSTHESLYNQALELHEKICINRVNANTYTSQGHNLPFEKSYKLLHFDDPASKKINAQSFIDYGGNGHQLTYFINNENIPFFIHQDLISRIRTMPPVKALATESQSPLNWRFTFNVYHQENSIQAGFDWHKDIATNGVITSITTIFGSAIFQIQPEENEDSSQIYSFSLTPGSIVLLSGDSRWKWKHRVLSQDSFEDHPIQRISLVLGCRPALG